MILATLTRAVLAGSLPDYGWNAPLCAQLRPFPEVSNQPNNCGGWLVTKMRHGLQKCNSGL